MQTNIELPSLKRFNNHAETLQLRLAVPMVWMHKIKFTTYGTLIYNTQT